MIWVIISSEKDLAWLEHLPGIRRTNITPNLIRRSENHQSKSRRFKWAAPSWNQWILRTRPHIRALKLNLLPFHGLHLSNHRWWATNLRSQLKQHLNVPVMHHPLSYPLRSHRQLKDLVQPKLKPSNSKCRCRASSHRPRPSSLETFALHPDLAQPPSSLHYRTLESTSPRSRSHQISTMRRTHTSLISFSN